MHIFKLILFGKEQLSFNQLPTSLITPGHLAYISELRTHSTRHHVKQTRSQKLKITFTDCHYNTETSRHQIGTTAASQAAYVRVTHIPVLPILWPQAIMLDISSQVSWN